MSSQTNMRPWIENYNLHENGHKLTDELVGKAVRLNYKSGHVLEQHWQTASQVLWKGISGGLNGYSQAEHYKMFKVSANIYFITWVEQTTTTVSQGPQAHGPWLTDVILDFNNMIATASWMGPTDNGRVEHVLDQAVMEYVNCENTTSNNDQ